MPDDEWHNYRIWQPGIHKKRRKNDYKSDNWPANDTVDKYTSFCLAKQKNNFVSLCVYYHKLHSKLNDRIQTKF